MNDLPLPSFTDAEVSPEYFEWDLMFPICAFEFRLNKIEARFCMAVGDLGLLMRLNCVFN
jgi:hypothetical protein